MALLARAPLLCAAFFATAPLLCAVAQYELHSRLYINQVSGGPGTNQAQVAAGSSNFGSTAASNWAILDKPPTDPSAQVHGHARGLFTLTNPNGVDSWFTVMNLEFEDPSRYDGSILTVTGTTPKIKEWSIVGGTGVFRMARGFVNYTTNTSGAQRVYTIDVNVIYGDATMRSERIVDN